MRLWSTEESIKNDELSWAALIETLVAVLFYWWLAVRYETYAPLMTGAGVAWLLLLRSEESVALGAKWFGTWESEWQEGRRDWHQISHKEHRLIFMVATVAAVVGWLVSYASAKTILANVIGMDAYWLGFGIGWLAVLVTVVIAVILAGIITITKKTATAALPGIGAGAAVGAAGCVAAIAIGSGGRTIAIVGASTVLLAGILAMIATGPGAAPTIVGGAVGEAVAPVFARTGSKLLTVPIAGAILLFTIPYFLGNLTGIFLISVLIRLCATARYMRAGLRNLPHNYRRLVFSTSLTQKPELVPGLRPDTSYFTLDSITKAFEQERQSNKVNVKVSAYLGSVPVIIFWRLPGLFYRFTLKSTSWFWWPLYLLAGELRTRHIDELRWRRIGSGWAKVRIWLAIGTIIAFIWVNLIATGKIFDLNPLLTVLGFFLLIDVSVPPWQVLTLAVATLVLVIAVLADHLGGLHKIQENRGDAISLARTERQIAWIEWLARFQLVLFILLQISVGAQTILYFNNKNCWFVIPSNVERWAKPIYGSKFPHARQCQ